MTERRANTERKEILNPLLYSLNGHNRQGWLRLKQGAWNSVRIPHTAGTPVLELTSVAFTGALAGS